MIYSSFFFSYISFSFFFSFFLSLYFLSISSPIYHLFTSSFFITWWSGGGINIWMKYYSFSISIFIFFSCLFNFHVDETSSLFLIINLFPTQIRSNWLHVSISMLVYSSTSYVYFWATTTHLRTSTSFHLCSFYHNILSQL